MCVCDGKNSFKCTSEVENENNEKFFLFEVIQGYFTYLIYFSSAMRVYQEQLSKDVRIFMINLVL